MHPTNSTQRSQSQKEESPELIQNEVWVQLSGRAAAYHAGRVEVHSPAAQTQVMLSFLQLHLQFKIDNKERSRAMSLHSGKPKL